MGIEGKAPPRQYPPRTRSVGHSLRHIDTFLPAVKPKIRKLAKTRTPNPNRSTYIKFVCTR